MLKPPDSGPFPLYPPTHSSRPGSLRHHLPLDRDPARPPQSATPPSPHPFPVHGHRQSHLFGHRIPSPPSAILSSRLTAIPDPESTRPGQERQPKYEPVPTPTRTAGLPGTALPCSHAFQPAAPGRHRLANTAHHPAPHTYRFISPRPLPAPRPTGFRHPTHYNLLDRPLSVLCLHLLSIFPHPDSPGTPPATRPFRPYPPKTTTNTSALPSDPLHKLNRVYVRIHSLIPDIVPAILPPHSAPPAMPPCHCLSIRRARPS